MALLQHIDKGGRPRSRETVLASKPNRAPINGARDVLKVDGLPRGLISRWVNDSGDRILRFREAGYEFVTTKGILVGERTAEQNPEMGESIGSIVCKRVGQEDGIPIMAYLMAIEEEFYAEDQKKKQDRLLRKERDISQPSKEQGQYGSVKFS